MHWKHVFICLALAGCAHGPTEVDPALVDIAQPILQSAETSSAASQLDTFIMPAQPAPYDAILRNKYQELRFGFDHNLNSLSISRLGGLQGRLPLVQPGAQVSSTGNAQIGVNVRQILFDGGVFRAQYATDDHEAILRQVRLLQRVNDEAADDIATFLRYRQNIERAALLTRLSHHLQALLGMAEMRATGGIGAASDASFLELKYFEIEADIQIARADAAADLAVLAIETDGAAPTEFAFAESHLPLAVIEAIAERQAAASALDLARAERNPKVALDGRLGIDPFTGLPVGNVRLDVQGEPIGWGGNVAVRQAEEELRLAEHTLELVTRNEERETRRLRGRISALTVQLEQTEILIQKADARFSSFNDQFLAGTAQLTEAVSLIETLRTSLETQVALEFEILDYQRQLAGQGGHFWAFRAEES